MERDKILEAAVNEFGERGLDATSLDDIAARAGVETATVRALFVDKENLLRTLLQEVTDPVVSATSLAVQDTDDPRELVRRSMTLLDRFMRDAPEYCALVRRCLVERGAMMQAVFERSMYSSEFFERLEAMAAAGRFRLRDSGMIGMMLDTLISSPYVFGIDLRAPGSSESEDEYSSRRLEAALDLLEHGLYNDDKS